MSNNYPPNNPPSGGSYPPPGQPYSTTPLPSSYQQRTSGFPPAGGPPPEKKGGALKYILGGCLAIIVIGVIIFAVGSYLVYNKAKQIAKDSGIDSELLQKNPGLAAAKAAVAVNPDLELVSADDDKGTITIRNKKTGETVTISADEASKGKFSFKKNGKDAGSIDLHANNNGSASFEVKSDDGTSKMAVGIAGTIPSWMPSYPGSTPQWDLTGSSKEGSTGNFHFITSDSTDKITSFYEDGLKAKGFKVTTTTTQSGASKTVLLQLQDDSNNRGGLVTITPESSGGNRVNVVYSAKP